MQHVSSLLRFFQEFPRFVTKPATSYLLIVLSTVMTDEITLRVFTTDGSIIREKQTTFSSDEILVYIYQDGRIEFRTKDAVVRTTGHPSVKERVKKITGFFRKKITRRHH